MTPTSKRCRLDQHRTNTIALLAPCAYRCPTITMSLPLQHPITTAPRLTLAEAVERVRWPRNRATVKLAPHREELIRLRQEGMSVGALMGGLRELGVEIGHETLRVWLRREAGHAPAKRRKGKSRHAAEVKLHTPVPLPVGGESKADLPKVAPTPKPTLEAFGGNIPVPEGTRFIRPCETPMQALQRRVAERRAREAEEWPSGTVPSGGQADKPITPPA